jgi:hypothetical protein
MNEYVDSVSLLSSLPRKVVHDDIFGRGKRRGFVIAEAAIKQSNYSEKAIVLQRIRWEKGAAHYGDEEIRLGYYDCRGGKVKWGQYALVLPPGDLSRLLDEARRKGVFS